MPHKISRRLASTAAAVAAFTLLPTVQLVLAGAQPYGTVLVAGPAWAGTTASLGDLNVYSNGSTYTGHYQCTDLAIRWATIRYGESPSWPAASAADMWRVGPTMPVPFEQIPNGNSAGMLPQFGDLIIYNVTPQFPSGHVAVVSGTSPGYVDVVEENASWTGRAILPVSGTTMPPRAGSNQPVIGWLRAQGSAYTPDPNLPGGQVLDSWGGVHPFGSAHPVTDVAVWPGWNIARDIVTQTGHGDSGYVLDGWGGIHAFGGAQPVQGTGYWPGWDIARSLVLRSDGHSGYVLDGWGGLHPFGVTGDLPPAITHLSYWSGWDIARSVALRSNDASGYVLDAFGGLHAFSATASTTPAVTATAYWPGWSIARAVVLASDSGGYVLDGYGGVHAFGTAPAVTVTGYYPWANARGLVLTGAGSGYVVFQAGMVTPFGDAPTVHVGSMSLPLGQAIG